ANSVSGSMLAVIVAFAPMISWADPCPTSTISCGGQDYVSTEPTAYVSCPTGRYYGIASARYDLTRAYLQLQASGASGHGASVLAQTNDSFVLNGIADPAPRQIIVGFHINGGASPSSDGPCAFCSALLSSGSAQVTFNFQSSSTPFVPTIVDTT